MDKSPEAAEGCMSKIIRARSISFTSPLAALGAFEYNAADQA
jgi:hypothetical protein